jgi:hypothetical protein
LIKEGTVRKLIIITALLIVTGISTSYARGGMHGSGPGALMAPANPAVPPSLTPDPRLFGSAPLPAHPQPNASGLATLNNVSLAPTPDEKKIDSVVNGICHGC